MEPLFHFGTCLETVLKLDHVRVKYRFELLSTALRLGTLPSSKPKSNLNTPIHFWQTSLVWSILMFCDSEPVQARPSSAVIGATSEFGDHFCN
jgi:hypothetical protein